MSKSNKRKLEILSMYTAMAVTFLCLVAIQTILITRGINGSQNQQYQTQSIEVSRDTNQPTKAFTVQTRQ